MATIERRSGGDRVRYRDPAGHNRSRTFKRKVDADRFAREVEVDLDRGDDWPHLLHHVGKEPDRRATRANSDSDDVDE